MSIPIVIQGTTIDFPSTAQSPDWSESVIQFAQAVETALKSAVGTYDVSPQIQNLTNASDIIISLSFLPSVVRSATIFYSVYRKSDTPLELTEQGTLEINYDMTRTAGSLWEMVRMFESDARISFSVSDLGQVSYSKEAISGNETDSIISFRAITTTNV
jgi:hypothetical protein